jgi:hypothetical protein
VLPGFGHGPILPYTEGPLPPSAHCNLVLRDHTHPKTAELTPTPVARLHLDSVAAQELDGILDLACCPEIGTTVPLFPPALRVIRIRSSCIPTTAAQRCWLDAAKSGSHAVPSIGLQSSSAPCWRTVVWHPPPPPTSVGWPQDCCALLADEGLAVGPPAPLDPLSSRSELPLHPTLTHYSSAFHLSFWLVKKSGNPAPGVLSRPY